MEEQRKEALERCEMQKIAILQDVTGLARQQELEIPETIVMQMMPKPKPLLKVENTEIQGIEHFSSVKELVKSKVIMNKNNYFFKKYFFFNRFSFKIENFLQGNL